MISRITGFLEYVVIKRIICRFKGHPWACFGVTSGAGKIDHYMYWCGRCMHIPKENYEERCGNEACWNGCNR